MLFVTERTFVGEGERERERERQGEVGRWMVGR